MQKDFLFFSYSWVKNANYYFKKIESLGYECDFVFETNLQEFKPIHKYKNIVLYLHEDWSIPITNDLINNYFKDSKLIQHDDTDFEDVQIWTNRKPDLILQREYTDSTKNYWNSKIYPFHFPMPSIYDSKYEKDIDISFMGTLTNARRLPFINHIINLSKGNLKHYKWYIDVRPADTRTPDLFKEISNRSKIGLHYFGNSYDSIRIWELASAGCSLVMPKMRTKIVNDDTLMPFKNYTIIKDDFSDLEEKLNYLMIDENYKKISEKSKLDYDLNHNPEKCFEYYFNKIKEVMAV